MAIAAVQFVSANSATFTNVTITSSGSTGHILTADVFWNSNTKSVAMTDSKGGAWTNLGSPKTGAGALAGWRFQQFVCLAPIAATVTVTATITLGAGENVACLAREWSGFVNTPTTDSGSPVYTNINSGSPTAGPITTTIPVALLFASCFPANTTSAIMSAPFTDQAGAGGDATWGAGSYGYRVVSATQSAVSATFTVVSGDNTTGVSAIGDVGSFIAPRERSYQQAVKRAAVY